MELEEFTGVQQYRDSSVSSPLTLCRLTLPSFSPPAAQRHRCQSQGLISKMARIDDFPHMVDDPLRYGCINLEEFESNGMLASCHLKVKIRRYEDEHESLYTCTWESAAEMVHPNMLKVYHAYRNNQSRRPLTLICESFSETLIEYINRKVRESGGCNSYWYRRVRDFTDLQPYVPLEVQNIFSDILKFLKDVHAMDRALSGFQIDHIVMVKDNPKFLGVFMVKAADDSMHADYMSMRTLINNVYKDIQKSIDIENLTWLLGDWRMNYGHIIFNHCSLWSSDRKMNLMRSFWERQGFLSAIEFNKKFLKMLQKINLPYDWMLQVPQTGPLREVYDYSIHTGHASQYQDTLLDLIRYIRAVGAHVGARSDKGNEMQEHDVEPIISMIFPGIFSKLQQGIYEMSLEKRLQDQ